MLGSEYRRSISSATETDLAIVHHFPDHEIMNAIGDWRYVTPEDIKTFGGSRARQEALSSDGWLGKEWLTK